MTSSVRDRLESWREVVRTGKPAWLADGAARTVALLEAELAAQAIETEGQDRATGLGAKHESAVLKGCAHSSSGDKQ